MSSLRQELDKLLATANQAQAKWEEKIRAAGNNTGLPKELAAIIALDPAKRTAKHKEALSRYFGPSTRIYRRCRRGSTPCKRSELPLRKPPPTTLITTAGPPRTIRVLPRGNWLDASGEIVHPATPGALPKLHVSGRQHNRLDLARWLTSAENPLLARVFVNRLWMLYFGQGIVKSLDDFGSQGVGPRIRSFSIGWPWNCGDSNWNIKQMIQLMVLSSTYRQASTANDAIRQRDPYNQLYARQARVRLPGELHP